MCYLGSSASYLAPGGSILQPVQLSRCGCSSVSGNMSFFIHIAVLFFLFLNPFIRHKLSLTHTHTHTHTLAYIYIYIYICICIWSRDGQVLKATGPGLISGRRNVFFLSHSVQTSSRTHTASCPEDADAISSGEM
jgi:hypothetical protein